MTFITSQHQQINEYTVDDVVFAISWSGKSYPDFKQLLGSKYLSQLKSAKSSGDGLSKINISHDDFVFTSSGIPHMLSGIAYIPSKVPANVTISQLQ